MIAALFWSTDFRNLGERFWSADPIWLSIGLFANLFFYLLRSIRWRIVLFPLKRRTGLRNLFSIVSLGYLVNLIIPLRVGEFLRAFLLQRREEIPFASGFLSIVIERILDLIAIVALAIVAIATTPQLPLWFLSTVQIVAVLATSALLLLLAGEKAHRPMTRLIKLTLSKTPKLSASSQKRILALAEDTFAGVKVLTQQPKGLLIVIIVLSILTWMALPISYFCVFAAFHIEIAMSALILGSMIMAASHILPNLPGHIGSYEALWVLVFMGLGFTAEAILPVAIVTHLTQMLLVVTLGALSLSWSNIGFREITRIEIPPSS